VRCAITKTRQCAGDAETSRRCQVAGMCQKGRPDAAPDDDDDDDPLRAARRGHFKPLIRVLAKGRLR
jgi:hypothetical protein